MNRNIIIILIICLVVGIFFTLIATVYNLFSKDENIVILMDFDKKFNISNINSTIIKDSSMYENHGVCNKNYCPKWTLIGINDGAIELDGTDDFIEIPNNDIFNFSDNLTILAWINPDTLGVNWIVSKWGGGKYADVKKMSFSLFIDLNNRLHFNLMGSKAYGRSNKQIESNKWTHVAAVYNGKNATLYINGKFDSSIQGTGIIEKSSTNIAIGAYHWNTSLNTFDGKMDDIIIFNKALNSEEIYNIYIKKHFK